MFLASVPLYVLARSARVPSSWGADLSVGGCWGQALPDLPAGGRPDRRQAPSQPHRLGLLLADGLLWMLSDVMDYYGIYGVARPGSVPFPLGVAGINDWLRVPYVGLLGTYVFLLFPNGRPPSERWRPLAWLSGVVVLVSIHVGLTPAPLENLGGYAARSR
jgi:hypothetical protein